MLASDPKHYGGGLTGDASDKLARFVDLCDQFRLPVVNFVDQPGFVIGTDAERAGTMRRGARALFAVHQATVPWVSVLVRKVYGVAGASHGDHSRLNLRYAWPSGDWGSLPIAGGLEAAYRRELEAAEDPVALRAEIEERLDAVRSPFRTAERFGVEEIIDPRDTRPLLCAWARQAHASSPTRRRRPEGARAAAVRTATVAPMSEHAFHADDVDVSPEDVRARHEPGEIQLIDVREDYEHAAGRIAGARHIELERVASQAATIDRDRPVVFYCRLGARSGMAANAFRRAGWEAYSMDGGLDAGTAPGCRWSPRTGMSRTTRALLALGAGRARWRRRAPPPRPLRARRRLRRPIHVASPPATATRLFVVQRARDGPRRAQRQHPRRPVPRHPGRGRSTEASAGCSRSPSRPTTRRPAASTST